MRPASLPCGLSLLLLTAAMLFGCQKVAPPTAPSLATTPSTPVLVSFGPGESIPAMFEVTVDPVGMQATSRPLTARMVAGFQASQFDLDITKFQTKAQFDVQSVEFTEIGDVEVTFRHAHPWKAVDISQPASATNRADLGYTGRLLILADLAPADILSHTFFTDVKANTELIRGADGYVQPGDLLAKSGFNANCFPYMLLADEAKDNRIGVSNGDVVTGNWDPAVGGWQRSNLGPTGDGWTGYDFVHAGQTIENSFVLNADELTGGPVTLQVALLIKYTEPKGIGGEVGVTLRLPPATVDVLQFAYRAPHAAIDGSAIRGLEPVIQLQGSFDAEVSLQCVLRDWDAVEAEASAADIASQSNIANIEPGTSGFSDMTVSCPGVVAAVGLTGQTGTTGKPADELEFTGVLSNQLGAPAIADRPALLRVTDPEATVGATGSPRLGVDPFTIVADTSRALQSVAFQAFTVRLVPPPLAWAAHEIEVAGVARAHALMILPGPTADPADDRFAVAYRMETTQELWMATAANLDPQQTSDWTQQVVATGDDVGETLSGVVHENKPVLLFANRDDGSMNVAMASTEFPLSGSDWTQHVVAPGVGVPVYQSKLIVDGTGHLAAMIEHPATVSFHYLRASVVRPTSTADWQEHEVVCSAASNTAGWDFTKVGTHLVLSAHTCPELSPDGRIDLLQSQDMTPTSASEWERLPASVIPGLSFSNLLFTPSHFYMAIRGPSTRLVSSPVATAAEPATWQLTTLPPFDGGGYLINVRLVSFGGLPMGVKSIYEGDPDLLQAFRALVKEPRAPYDWQTSMISDTTYALHSGQTLLVGNRLVTTYIAAGSGHLTLAVSPLG